MKENVIRRCRSEYFPKLTCKYTEIFNTSKELPRIPEICLDISVSGDFKSITFVTNDPSIASSPKNCHNSVKKIITAITVLLLGINFRNFRNMGTEKSLFEIIDFVVNLKIWVIQTIQRRSPLKLVYLK